ncbi:hypothetical protein B0J17DRAFT_627659 [Rhizoctonia solani]|nr:hypothetical protein B0J17DRAFT_627659 [Rhizoctonia solani]
MRPLRVLSIVASIGLLSGEVHTRPVPPRAIYPYPIYRTDNLTALDLRTLGEQTLKPQTHLELSFAAFSKAIEVGFVNVVIRPHEHLASLLRYYKTPERFPALPIDAKYGLEWSTSNPKKHYKLRSPGGSEENPESNASSFPVHDRQKRESDSSGAAAVRAPDYRRDIISKHETDALVLCLDYRRLVWQRYQELDRSNTHKISKEFILVAFYRVLRDMLGSRKTQIGSGTIDSESIERLKRSAILRHSIDYMQGAPTNQCHVQSNVFEFTRICAVSSHKSRELVETQVGLFVIIPADDMTLLLDVTPFLLFVSICPTTLMLFALRRVSGPSNRSSLVKTTDFYATLLFGVFMTIAGVFGMVAESQVGSASRWWTSAASAMQMLGILIAQLAVIQLLTPDYLFGLLSINTATNALPPLRIYTVILITLFVKLTRSSARVEPPATISCTGRNSKCIDLELSAADMSPFAAALRFPRIWGFALALQIIAVFSIAGEVAEGALGYRTPIIRLLSAIGIVTWGGGIMTIHFIIIYEPTYRSPMVLLSPRAPLMVWSALFMTLKDPFASPTQAGFCLPPSPPRAAPHRRPRRRASEPLQLKRFGSFAVLAEDVKEKQAGSEEEQHTQFLEELVRHAWFSTGRTDSDSMRNNSHECNGPPSTPAQGEESVFTDVPPDARTSGRPGGLAIDTSTPSIPSCNASARSAPVSLDLSSSVRFLRASYVVPILLAFISSVGTLASSKRIYPSIRIHSTSFTRKLGFWVVFRVPAPNADSRAIETVFAVESTRCDAQ